jgi:hypothetical protein
VRGVASLNVALAEVAIGAAFPEHPAMLSRRVVRNPG